MHFNKKRFLSAAMAAMLLTGAAACGKEDKETIGTETVEGALGAAAAGEDGKKEDSGYTVTGENENKELVFANQPEASYWFPAELLEWDASADADLAYNISTVPLAVRADAEALTPVNGTQNKQTKVMALSIMNSSTSGNAPHGLNVVDANTFSYWQYVDLLVYWGGSSGEGLIVPPSPDVVDAAHKNGVKVAGTIFFPQNEHGGKMEWLEDFLTQDASGSYPIVDKLIEVAETYGFDGWFFNQETQGTEEEPLTGEHAAKMCELIAELKEKAPQLEAVYYDSMTESGELDWQNALTEENVVFLKDKDGNPVADDMFLNFWWTEEELVEEDLLAASASLAEEKGIDPYAVYAGMDVQSDGYNTDIRWDLLENPEGGTYTSIGLYCPSWTYFSADTMQDFWKQENKLWVNEKGDPSAEITYSSDTKWRGISTYIIERTAITELPFITNFSQGSGYGFYKNGTKISDMDWNNRGIADVLPTYRYIIEQENNSLTADLDVGDAWYGGNSIILRGSVKAGEDSKIRLYACDLPVNGDVIFTTTAKANTSTKLVAVVTFSDGTQAELAGSQAVGTEWTTVEFDTAQLAGKTVREISYTVTPEEENNIYQFRFGNITLAEGAETKASAVSNAKVESQEFDEDSMYAGVRLVWESDVPAAYYEVYAVLADETRSFLGASNTTNFYVNALPRLGDTNKTTFEIVPVTDRFLQGTAAQADMEWPDNSLPKAGFTADHTLVAPGETISFTSLCSQNTEKVSWTLEGADTENAAGETVRTAYQQPGTYTVTVTAENASGTDTKTIEGFIVVEEKAAEGLALLSSNAPAEADTFVNDNEAPEFAVDGDYKKKWCATGSAPHEITLDLGAVKTVSEVDVYHAEAGGEGADMNTKSYIISVSEDGINFTDVISVTRNTAGTTHDTFAPVQAQYVKLLINKPTQGSDSAARIYEIEVFGLEN